MAEQVVARAGTLGQSAGLRQGEQREDEAFRLPFAAPLSSGVLGSSSMPGIVGGWIRLRAAGVESRMAQAQVLQIIGEPDAAGVAGRSGYCTVARRVVAVALIRSGDARNRIGAANGSHPASP